MLIKSNVSIKGQMQQKTCQEIRKLRYVHTSKISEAQSLLRQASKYMTSAVAIAVWYSRYTLSEHE